MHSEAGQFSNEVNGQVIEGLVRSIRATSARIIAICQNPRGGKGLRQKFTKPENTVRGCEGCLTMPVEPMDGDDAKVKHVTTRR
jgi:hypothetical protein